MFSGFSNSKKAELAANSVFTTAAFQTLSSNKPRNGWLFSYSCQQCTYVNEPAAKTCSMCHTPRPAVSTISLIVHLYDQPTETPLQLPNQKINMKVDYLKDVLESKTKIPFDCQVLLFNGSILESSNDNAIIDLLGAHIQNLSEPIHLAVANRKQFNLESSKMEAQSTAAVAPPTASNSTKSTAASSSTGVTASSAKATDECVDGEDWGKMQSSDDGWGSSVDAKSVDRDGDWGDSADSAGWDDDTIDTNDMKTAEADNFDYNGSSGSSSSSSSESSTANYRILTYKDVDQRIESVVKECSDTFSVPVDYADLLMRAYRWNMDAISSAIISDEVQMRKQSGVPSDAQLEAFKKAIAKQDPKAELECELCYNDVPPNESLALSCLHRYCHSCWKRWCRAQFDTKGPNALRTKCMHDKCSLVLPLSEQNHFFAVDDRTKLHLWHLDHFVSNSKTLKWCNGSMCKYAFEAKSTSAPLYGVECYDGHTMCFNCGVAPDHSPCSCKTAEEWTKKNNSESENMLWIQANTKICPACRVHIEKNQGCNHMTCRKCGHEFCWLCKGNWRSHSSCGVFKGDDATTNEAANAQKAKNELDRYMHYFTRYDNHAKSVKFAEKTRAEAAKKAESLQAVRGAGLTEVQFIVDAVSAIVRCRRVLSWSYAYAYFKKWNAEFNSSDKLLFENFQQQLEELTERLHGLIERPLEKLTDTRVRTDIISLTRSVEKYRTNVVKVIQQSYATDS